MIFECTRPKKSMSDAARFNAELALVLWRLMEESERCGVVIIVEISFFENSLRERLWVDSYTIILRTC